MSRKKPRNPGDPSRIPPMDEHKWTCQGCGKDNVTLTRNKKFVAPEYCDKVCAKLPTEKLARQISLQELGFEIGHAEGDYSGLFSSIVKYGELLELARTSPRRIRVRVMTCPQCQSDVKHFHKDYEGVSGNVRPCSSYCGLSKKVGLPVGVVCRNPHKLRFDTQEEAEVAVIKANLTLKNDGDEPMVSYSCTCGQWHFGHTSKALMSDQLLEVRGNLKKKVEEVLAV